MQKSFNTEGKCNPKLHYMVNLDERLSKIKRLVDKGKYFIINRARQYGKTTTLAALEQYLKKEYIVFSLDFQKISSAKFQNESVFSVSFAELLLRTIDSKKEQMDGVNQSVLDKLRSVVRNGGTDNGSSDFDLMALFYCLSDLCALSSRPIVLMIDEVDSATNNQVFLDFLGQLRGYFLDRESVATFHSVILAGVYDVKNLKLKIRPDAEHRYNSPWNIATKFNVDMSFSVQDIAGMLREYDCDAHTGMDIQKTADIIYGYTSGYPYLVSDICKIMDEELPEHGRFAAGEAVWSEAGVAEAVKVILKEPASLFESMVKQLDIYPALKKMLSDMIYQGKTYPYSPLDEAVNIGMMFGFLKEQQGLVAVANRIFEMSLLNLFTMEEAMGSPAYCAGVRDKNQFIRDGVLNMDLVLEKFVKHYSDVFADRDEKFLEETGRKIFLMYLKPIINGVGNYYMESATRDMTRTDVIVDYLGRQYIVEMKIWHGNAYNERGETQLQEYLDLYHLTKGYMLSFNFNKNKKPGVRRIDIGNKVLVEAVV